MAIDYAKAIINENGLSFLALARMQVIFSSISPCNGSMYVINVGAKCCVGCCICEVY